MFRQDFVHCCVTDYIPVTSKNNPYTSKTIIKGSQTELQRRISHSSIVYFELLEWSSNEIEQPTDFEYIEIPGPSQRV